MQRDVVDAVGPDILVLTAFDFDHDLLALKAFRDALATVGTQLPHLFAQLPNAGVASGVDLNGDGRLGTADDALGYGTFAGQGGMAILSRFPFNHDQFRDLSGILWRDLPEQMRSDRVPIHPLQPVASVGHWDVPVQLPDGTQLHLLAFHATTPAFDGPEDRNGFRNRAELGLWASYLDGALGIEPPNARFIVIGDANLDPSDGQGQKQAIRDLLARPDLQDPEPKSQGAIRAAEQQAGVNARQSGDPALDTADWRDDTGPGNLRVDYILPSKDLTIVDSGVFWPSPDQAGYDILKDRDPLRSWHGLVWVDIAW